MRRKRQVLAAAGCLLTLCALLHPAGNAQAFDYVQNASFEDGTTGWLTVGDGLLTTVDASAVPPPDGAHVAELILEGTAFTVRQPAVSNVPPGTYHLAAAVRSSNASTRVFARASTISPSTSFREEYAASAANLWETIAFDFDVPETSDVKIEVGAQGATGDTVYVDNVHFEGAPPATATPTMLDTSTNLTLTPQPTQASPTKTPTRTHTPAPTRTPAAADASIGSQLQNGGFEDSDDAGQLAAWHRYGGSRSIDSSHPHSGARAARFESATSSTKWIYQTLLIDPNSAYAFSAWIYDADDNVSVAFLRVSWYASADGSGSAIGSVDSTTRLESPNASYQLLTTGPIAPVAGAQSANVRVMLAPVSGAAAVISIDDASFEPASLEDAELAASSHAPSSPDAAVVDSAAPASQVRSSKATAKAKNGGVADPDGATIASNAHVVINEVLYDPDNGGTDASGEWVELYNAGNDAIDLKGWTLTDNGGSDALPAYRLDPGQFAVVAASDSLRTSAPGLGPRLIVLGGRIGNSLGNTGDRLSLKDANGAVSDAISWGSDTRILDPAIEEVPAGHSIERRTAGEDTDSAADFVDNIHPSPGSAYDPSSAKSQHEVATTGDVLAPSSSGVGKWLPWAAAAVAGAALAVVAGWQALPLVRRRFQHLP